MSVVSYVSGLFKQQNIPEPQAPALRTRSGLLQYLDHQRNLVCCQAHAFLQKERVIVVVTDLTGRFHCGANITNTIERVAQEACRQFEIDADRLVLIEHFPGQRRDHMPDPNDEGGEQFHWVKLHWDAGHGRFRDPTWIGLSRRAVETLLEQPLAEGLVHIGDLLCKNG